MTGLRAATVTPLGFQASDPLQQTTRVRLLLAVLSARSL